MPFNTEKNNLSGWAGPEIIKTAKEFEELLANNDQVVGRDYSVIDLLKLAVGKVMIEAIDGAAPMNYTSGFNEIVKAIREK